METEKSSKFDAKFTDESIPTQNRKKTANMINCPFLKEKNKFYYHKENYTSKNRSRKS